MLQFRMITNSLEQAIRRKMYGSNRFYGIVNQSIEGIFSRRCNMSMSDKFPMSFRYHRFVIAYTIPLVERRFVTR